jgi:hypothetical protein
LRLKLNGWRDYQAQFRSNPGWSPASIRTDVSMLKNIIDTSNHLSSPLYFFFKNVNENKYKIETSTILSIDIIIKYRYQMITFF